MELPYKSAFDRTVQMVLSSDHVTGATGKTLTIVASKAGATGATITPTVTEITNLVGRYKLALTAAHLDTLGSFDLYITASGCDPTDTNDLVTPAPLGAATMHVGSITGASPTNSTLVDSSLTQTFTDFWAGRRIIFTSGNLKGSGGTITAFTPASDTLTFSAQPTTPAQNDTYIIV
jgi:hypothetical protein